MAKARKATSHTTSRTTSPKTSRKASRRAGAASRRKSLSSSPELDRLQAVIFDVEGTLVDTVFPTLLCWQEILRNYQLDVTTAELHHFSGLGSEDMLSCLLPHGVAATTRTEMAARHEDLYKTKYLPTVTPLAGIPALMESLKAAELQIALATTADRDILDHYLKIAGCPESLFDAVACGTDADRTKPDPQLLHIALRRLSLRASRRILSVGDTPYDAEAALACGVVPVGVLTGYFSRPDLQAVGCSIVCKDAVSLAPILDLPQTAARRDKGKSFEQEPAVPVQASS